MQVVPLANYYVLQGTIYQAPDLHHVLNSRLAGTLFHLQEALDKTLKMSRFATCNITNCLLAVERQFYILSRSYCKCGFSLIKLHWYMAKSFVKGST